MSAEVYGPEVLQTLQAQSLPQALLNPPFPAVTVMGHSQSQMLMMYLVQWREEDGATKPPGLLLHLLFSLRPHSMDPLATNFEVLRFHIPLNPLCFKT